MLTCTIVQPSSCIQAISEPATTAARHASLPATRAPRPRDSPSAISALPPLPNPLSPPTRALMLQTAKKITMARALVLASLVAAVRAHFSLTTAASGGAKYSTMADAYIIEHVDRSQFSDRVGVAKGHAASHTLTHARSTTPTHPSPLPAQHFASTHISGSSLRSRTTLTSSWLEAPSR